MFVNREPRFYVNICFNGAYWIGDQKTRIQLYYTGGSGKKGTWDYPRSGYIAIKNVSPSSNPLNNNYIKRPFLMMRYAEMLLNYVEALNEYDPGNPDILTYLNMVRKRAGVPDIEKVYPEAVGNQKQMRELIRRERMVELCYENHRYFDIRTWMIAETEHGDVYGMNIDATNHNANSAFWKRTLSTRDSGLSANGHRKFSPRGYLFPISQEEMDRTNCTQNYGW